MHAHTCSGSLTCSSSADISDTSCPSRTSFCPVSRDITENSGLYRWSILGICRNRPMIHFRNFLRSALSLWKPWCRIRLNRWTSLNSLERVMSSNCRRASAFRFSLLSSFFCKDRFSLSVRSNSSLRASTSFCRVFICSLLSVSCRCRADACSFLSVSCRCKDTTCSACSVNCCCRANVCSSCFVS